jgi:uncharacterized protein (DUF4415 family)
MKQRKRVTPRPTQQRKIPRLRASAEGGEVPLTRWQEMRRDYKTPKKLIRLYLDADVLAWFRKDGQGYQTRINRALQKFMRDQSERSGK